MKILLVEDNRELGDLVEKTLTAERYVVERAVDYRTACSKVGDYDYDCILLDLMLPDGNGLDVLRRVKDLGKSDSVIIISAKDAIDDKVAGLTLGADDYLAKPFHIAELVARIRSVARRRNAGKLEISFGNVVLHPETHSVEVAGQPLTLSRKEYDIIHYFLMRPGHMIRKESLAEAVWGDHIDQTDDFDFLYAQMKNVRRRLGDAGADVEIKAVYGFGYKLSQKE
ncbi:MAG: response regulator transcription factor [Tidjanibacter sp.]|nr:response regulator transcription factor [Tidjanibacter sp.]